MRRKVQHNRTACRIGQLLLDLRRMAMARNTVCLDIFIHLTVQVCNLCTAPCPGGTALCINNQRIHIDQSLCCQRKDRSNGAGGITARICYQTSLFDRLTVSFTQTVNRFRNKLRRFMFDSIPLFISSNVLDPKIRTQIDHLCIGKDFLIQNSCQEALGRRGKDHIDLFCQLL